MTTYSQRQAGGVRVFIADDDPDTFAFLKETVTGGEGWALSGTAQTVGELLSETGQTDVDVMLVSSAFLALMSREDNRRLTAGNPGSVILAITDSHDYVELKAALRHGARDAIICDAAPDAIRALIEEHYLENAARINMLVKQSIFKEEEPSETVLINSAKPEAKIMVVTGADGGKGKSFVAAQIAGLLALHGQAETCLVDMDFEYGALTTVLSDAIDIKHNILDLIPVADELSLNHIESILAPHPAGFNVIPGPAATQNGSSEAIPVRGLLTILKERFQAVVCDMPGRFLTEQLSRQVDLINIVITPDRVSALNARRLEGRLGAGRLIVNMSDRPGALSTRQIQDFAGMPVEASVPEDVGAGRLFDEKGVILADRTNLAVVRSLLPLAQRCHHFEELRVDRRFGLTRKRL